MPSTYEPISTQTLGSAVSSVTFSSIPSTYTDLVFIIGTKNATDSYVNTTYNDDTASNYSQTKLVGTNTNAVSGTGSNQSAWQSFYTYSDVNFFNTVIINIMNYANTTTYKSSLMRENAAGKEVNLMVSLWRKSPEAIHTVKFTKVSGNFDTGSTFTLYGIKAA